METVAELPALNVVVVPIFNVGVTPSCPLAPVAPVSPLSPLIFTGVGFGKLLSLVQLNVPSEATLGVKVAPSCPSIPVPPEPETPKYSTYL